ncbi:hypothetical protein SAFG77S_05487 [Streptomyces afghaniensis]
MTPQHSLLTRKRCTTGRGTDNALQRMPASGPCAESLAFEVTQPGEYGDEDGAGVLLGPQQPWYVHDQGRPHARGMPLELGDVQQYDRQGTQVLFPPPSFRAFGHGDQC